MNFPDEIYSKAKDLYLMPNIKGEHAYSFEMIAKSLSGLWADKKTPSPSTLRRWARERRDSGQKDSEGKKVFMPSWEDEWSGIIQKAIVNSTKHLDKEVQKDDAVHANVEAFMTTLAKQSMGLILKGFRFFQDTNNLKYMPKDPYEALQMINTGFNTFQSMRGELAQADREMIIEVVEITKEGAKTDVTDKVNQLAQTTDRIRGAFDEQDEVDSQAINPETEENDEFQKQMRHNLGLDQGKLKSQSNDHIPHNKKLKGMDKPRIPGKNPNKPKRKLKRRG